MDQLPRSMLARVPELPQRHSSSSRSLPISQRKAQIPRCLEIPEILFHIFEHVYVSHKGRSDLARLARTCKLLSGPALDVLWRIQTSFYPLIMTFPPTLLNFAPSDQMAVATFVRAHLYPALMATQPDCNHRQSRKNPWSLIGDGQCNTRNASEPSCRSVVSRGSEESRSINPFCKPSSSRARSSPCSRTFRNSATPPFVTSPSSTKRRTPNPCSCYLPQTPFAR